MQRESCWLLEWWGGARRGVGEMFMRSVLEGGRESVRRVAGPCRVCFVERCGGRDVSAKLMRC